MSFLHYPIRKANSPDDASYRRRLLGGALLGGRIRFGFDAEVLPLCSGRGSKSL
jgi:hypothetical protein